MPDMHVHTLVVRDHEIKCCDPIIVENSMGHDAIQLDLDSEWDGLDVNVVLVGPDYAPYDVIWDGEPVTVPAALVDEPRWLPVGVVGYGDGGKVRVLTARADKLLKVVPSGPFDGDEPVPDPPDVLGQLLEARDEALAAAHRAEEAAEHAESVKRGTQVSVTDGRPTIGGIEGDSAIDPTTGTFWEFVDTESTD